MLLGRRFYKKWRYRHSNAIRRDYLS